MYLYFTQILFTVLLIPILSAAELSDFKGPQKPEIQIHSSHTLKPSQIHSHFDALEENSNLVFSEHQKRMLIAGNKNSGIIADYKRYQIQKNPGKVRRFFKDLQDLEHQFSGNHREEIVNLRHFTFTMVHGATLIIWTFKTGMEWDNKAVAMVLASLGNWFFIYYENIMDGKVFDHPLPPKVFRVPLKKLFKIVSKMKEIADKKIAKVLEKDVSFMPGKRSNPDVAAHYWATEAGRFLMMSLANGVFIYAYQYLQLSTGGFISGEVALASMKAFAYYLATGIIFAFPRGNLKKYGRKYLSELQIHRMSVGLNLGVGASFLLLVTNVVSENLVLGAFGGSGLFLAWATNKDRLEKSLGFLKSFKRLSCKKVF